MYQISYPSGTILKDGIEVPMIESTPEYQAYYAWLQKGGSLTPVQDTKVAYQQIVVSAWQIRKALNAMGLRAQVEQSVAASGNQNLQDGWEYAPEFFSDNPLTNALGYSLGKTADEMYQLFQLAESL